MHSVFSKYHNITTAVVIYSMTLVQGWCLSPPLAGAITTLLSLWTQWGSDTRDVKGRFQSVWKTSCVKFNLLFTTSGQFDGEKPPRGQTLHQTPPRTRLCSARPRPPAAVWSDSAPSLGCRCLLRSPWWSNTAERRGGGGLFYYIEFYFSLCAYFEFLVYVWLRP